MSTNCFGNNMICTKVLLDTIPKVRKFCEITQSFKKDVVVVSGRFRVDGKSLMGLFSLDLSTPVLVHVYEEDEEIARMLFNEFEVSE